MVDPGPLAPQCAPDAHCITCGDEGVRMRVVALDAASALAECESGDGTRSTVDVGLVDPVAEGTVLLVHAGTALTRLEEAA
jgi:hydrogenase maturation factor